jgi:molecular chaperone GrpE
MSKENSRPVNDEDSAPTAPCEDGDQISSEADVAASGEPGLTGSDEQESEASVEVDQTLALRQEVQEAQTALAEAQARLRTVSKAYTDLKEEMAAFRTRIEAQSKYKEQRKAFEVVQTFFEPVQNLKRSVDNSGDDVEGLVAGLKMVVTQFDGAMTKLGLAEVPGVGARFDPKVHQALAVVPVDSAEQDGMILHLHVGGFVVDGKVLQAAQVVVGKYESPELAEEVEILDAEADAVSEEPPEVVIDAEPIGEA